MLSRCVKLLTLGLLTFVLQVDEKLRSYSRGRGQGRGRGRGFPDARPGSFDRPPLSHRGSYDTDHSYDAARPSGRPRITDRLGLPPPPVASDRGEPVRPCRQPPSSTGDADKMHLFYYVSANDCQQRGRCSLRGYGQYVQTMHAACFRLLLKCIIMT